MSVGTVLLISWQVLALPYVNNKLFVESTSWSYFRHRNKMDNLWLHKQAFTAYINHTTRSGCTELSSSSSQSMTNYIQVQLNQNESELKNFNKKTQFDWFLNRACFLSNRLKWVDFKKKLAPCVYFTTDRKTGPLGDLSRPLNINTLQQTLYPL